MKCVNCGKELSNMDKYFNLSASCVDNTVHNGIVCADCAEVVTPMELYMAGKISMYNSDDDMVETSALIVE